MHRIYIHMNNYNMNASNGNCSLPLSLESLKIVAAIRGASALISLVFSISAVILNVLSKKYLVPFQRMVLYYSVSCVLTGITKTLGRVDYFVENEGTRAVCIMTAFADEYASWTSILATFSLAFHLCIGAFGHSIGGNTVQRFWILLIFVFPLTFNWIPFIHLAYGQSADWAWCSFRRVLEDCTVNTLALVLNYVLWFVPAVIMIILIIILYALSVFVVIRRRALGDPMCRDPEMIMKKRKMEAEVATLVLPVLLFFFTNGTSLLISINEQSGKSVFPLWVVYATFQQMSAGLTALLMTADKDSCSKVMRCSLLRPGDPVKEYTLQPAIGNTGTLPHPH